MKGKGVLKCDAATAALDAPKMGLSFRFVLCCWGHALRRVRSFACDSAL